jgi:hypothetical protein
MNYGNCQCRVTRMIHDDGRPICVYSYFIAGCFELVRAAQQQQNKEETTSVRGHGFLLLYRLSLMAWYESKRGVRWTMPSGMHRRGPCKRVSLSALYVLKSKLERAFRMLLLALTSLQMPFLFLILKMSTPTPMSLTSP